MSELKKDKNELNEKDKKFSLKQFVNNPWTMLVCNMCSILGLFLTCVFNNTWCIIIFCIFTCIMITVVSFYMIYRVVSLKRAKSNIHKKYIAMNKNLYLSLHRFFHDLRDCNNFLDSNEDISLDTFEDKAKNLCNQIENIFSQTFPTKEKVSVCIKLIETKSILNNNINQWEVKTFARSISTSDERLNFDRGSDKIIENTDFEIIVSDDEKFRNFNYFCCEDLDSYPKKFKEEYTKEFKNSHSNYNYKSAIVVPIRINGSKMSPILKKHIDDDRYYHVIGFLCIDSDEKFLDVKDNFNYTIFHNNAKLACAIGDSLYHFFESFLIRELSSDK